MRLLLTILFWFAAATAQEQGKILRPVDGAALPDGVEMSIIARGGKLELDGKPVPADQPFPEVLHAKTKPAPGTHTLALTGEGGRQEIRFFVGGNPPAGFKAFRQHPPLAVDCNQCHGLSARGRFRFKGGCFDCHKEEGFLKTHSHKPDVLVECGQCHNAHGSTEKALLVMPREKACKLCHN
jgi:predicted CXXCH cytochrome family protein